MVNLGFLLEKDRASLKTKLCASIEKPPISVTRPHEQLHWTRPKLSAPQSDGSRNTDAMTNLGAICYHGEGAASGKAGSVARRTVNEDAMNGLGHMHKKGEGVTQETKRKHPLKGAPRS